MHGATTKSVIVGVFTLLCATNASAQLLKCVGKDGRVEYAAQCPPGSRQQDTGIRSTPSSPAPADSSGSAKSLAEREAEFRKRREERAEEQAKAAKKAEEDARRQRACLEAQSYLKNLQAGNRVFKVDPKTGERAYLDDSQYAGEVATAQKSVENSCK